MLRDLLGDLFRGPGRAIQGHSLAVVALNAALDGVNEGLQEHGLGAGIAAPDSSPHRSDKEQQEGREQQPEDQEHGVLRGKDLPGEDQLTAAEIKLNDLPVSDVNPGRDEQDDVEDGEGPAPSSLECTLDPCRVDPLALSCACIHVRSGEGLLVSKKRALLRR